MEELKPIVDALIMQPVAFLGGLFSGFLRLSPDQDPLKSWLNQQGATPTSSSAPPEKGPQTISID